MRALVVGYLLASASVLASARWVAAQAPAATIPRAEQPEQPEKRPALFARKPLEVAAGEDELARLLKERFNAALEELAGRYERWQAGIATTAELAGAAHRLAGSGLALARTTEEKVKLLAELLEVMQLVESVAQRRVELGIGPAVDYQFARHERLNVEIRVVELQREVRESK